MICSDSLSCLLAIGSCNFNKILKLGPSNLQQIARKAFFS
jgi:hypothetical protein